MKAQLIPVYFMAGKNEDFRSSAIYHFCDYSR